MGLVRRVYVEKRAEYAVKSKELCEEIRNYLSIGDIEGVRILIRYDIEDLSEKTYKKALGTVFSEPPVDKLYEEKLPIYLPLEKVFSVEYLPGQFDQRADSAVQCLKLLSENEEPIIRTATTYLIEGGVRENDMARIKAYCINAVDSREASVSKPDTLQMKFEEPHNVKVFEGFTEMDSEGLAMLYDSLHLAMTLDDFKHIQRYFAGEEKRNPSETEIKVLDTYWSDHCRHTTFLTELKNITFEEGLYKKPIEAAYMRYLKDREQVFANQGNKHVSLMDVALMAMRKLKLDGKLEDMEVSDEINACSIIVPVDVDGETEEWLISFKNETHNHPTEIEPFGGAATCLGGAIRDPLSGRSYVYQAMRVTGAADPTLPMDKTIKGKLPQRKIVTGAADGYSSYGNQIGLSTGLVSEIYHPGYAAKRMEIGAVIGAAPKANVIRESADPGDLVILLGGRTGRDGCGGATGSSKAHTEESIDICGAEVQKGNPPTERKIQRLFRRPEVSRLIKKCNDFGAGGVSVAIGELADGLCIDLDKVPKKYEGLNGTELAISESQERMAVVVDKQNVEKVLFYAQEENLEAVVAAEVTKEPRLIMLWRKKEIVNISRAFLDTNGAHQETNVEVAMPSEKQNFFGQTKEMGEAKKLWLEQLSSLNICSQKGLVEIFDSSIGAGTVCMPYGGKYQMTPMQAMVAKVPVYSGETNTITMMSYGYDPYLSSWSPYHGAVYAVLHSVAKIVAVGGDFQKIRLTFQEYFKRLGDDPKRWGEPFAALLGAYDAQMGLGIPSIGGKDSMSGSYNTNQVSLDVPPTLVSFAVNTGKIQNLVTPEFKQCDSKIIKFSIARDMYDLPDYNKVMEMYHEIYKLMGKKVIISAFAIDSGGVVEAVSKMAFGNKMGVAIHKEIRQEDLCRPEYGSMIAEVPEDMLELISIPYTELGEVNDSERFTYPHTIIRMAEATRAWTGTLEEVFPTDSDVMQTMAHVPMYEAKNIVIAKHKVAKPTVFIPVFPGTNCEYDSARAFEEAGAIVNTVVFKNLNANMIQESVTAFEKAIGEAQIIMFPGGFSAGDEPDGSGKFIATAFRNERIKEQVHMLLRERDGLILGICNGFQSVIKLGLVPFGEIREMTKQSPTLTTNHIGRHISKMVRTKVVSNRSPWLQKAELGGTYMIPASHGEGRFVASDECIKELIKNGQIATQYCDLDGNATMNEDYNPNGSYYAIEGITSLDGRVLGKMCHSERIGRGVAMNITGNQNQQIFESGVAYFL